MASFLSLQSLLTTPESQGTLNCLQHMVKTEEGANQNKEGKTLLCLAAEKGNAQMVEFLLQKKADPNLRSISWEIDLESDTGRYRPYSTTSLCKAAEKGHALVVKILCEYKANVNQPNGHLYSPLLLAAKKGHLEITRTLLDYKADINSPHLVINRTPLQIAILFEQFSMANFLLEAGAKIDRKGPDEQKGSPYESINTEEPSSPLIDVLRAANSKQSQIKREHIVQHLLQAGADIKATDVYGRGAFEVACLNFTMDTKTLQLLLNYGIKITKEEASLLLLKVIKKADNAEVVEFLLHQGADIEKTDEEGNNSFSLILKKLQELEGSIHPAKKNLLLTILFALFRAQIYQGNFTYAEMVKEIAEREGVIEKYNSICLSFTTKLQKACFHSIPSKITTNLCKGLLYLER